MNEDKKIYLTKFTILNILFFLLNILIYGFLNPSSFVNICFAIVFSCFAIVLIPPNYLDKRRLIEEALFYCQLSFLLVSNTLNKKMILDYIISYVLTVALLIGIAIMKSLPCKMDLIRRIVFFLFFEFALFCVQSLIQEQSELLSFLQFVQIDSDQLIQFVFPIITGSILTYYITYIFDAARKHETRSKERKIAHDQIYIKSAIMILGNGIFILLSFLILYDIKKIIFRYNNFSFFEYLLITIFVITIFILLFLRLSHIKNYDRNVVKISIIISIVLYSLNNLFLFSRIIQTFIYPTISNFFLYVYAVSSLFVAVGVAYIIYEGFMSNLCYIQDVAPIKNMKYNAIVILINIIITIIQAAILMIGAHEKTVNLFNLTISIASLLISILFLPILISQLYKKTLYNKVAIAIEPELENKAIIDGVFQDSCTYATMTCCLLGFSSFCYITAKNASSNWFVFSFLLQISWIVFFAMRNNVKRSRKGTVGRIYDIGVWEKRNSALEKHLLAQNVCGILICMPYMLIKLSWDVCKILLKGGSFKQWFLRYFYIKNSSEFKDETREDTSKETSEKENLSLVCNGNKET